MQANAATELRDWIGQIESALGVIISATDEGAFSLYTRGDRAILIEPVRGQLALVLTGALSETDETMSANLFRALLAANGARHGLSQQHRAASCGTDPDTAPAVGAGAGRLAGRGLS